MLILAGIVIAQLNGQNGLIANSKKSKEIFEYTSAKEEINLTLMSVVTKCEEKKIPYSLEELIETIRNDDEKVIEKMFNTNTGSIKTGAEIVNPSDIVITVKKYSKYKFLVGQTAEIEGVTTSEITNDTTKNDFKSLNDFENELTSVNSSSINNNIKISLKNPITQNYEDKIIKIEIQSSQTIKSIKLNNEELTIPNNENGKYILEKQVSQNGDYTVTAIDTSNKSNTAKISVTDIINIYTKEDMELFRNLVNSKSNFSGKTIQLQNDIDLEGSETNQWTPIGTTTYKFAGTFDGNYHIVKGIYINKSGAYNGLFAYNVGTIQKLATEGSITGNSIAGGICACNEGTIGLCINSCSISSSDGSNGISHGATPTTGIIEKCGNFGTVTSGGAANGIGCLMLTINECFNVGKIIKTGTSTNNRCSRNCWF